MLTVGFDAAHPGIAERRAPPAADGTSAPASTDERPHAVVIGSGFGGLAAAVRLGARGYRVTVLEQLAAPGGRACVHRQDGFVFDAGPTVITAPFLFEELWALAGRRMSDDVDLRPVSPFYRVQFDDGERFEYTGDAASMRAEVARITRHSAPADVDGYDRFLAASEAIYRVGFEALGDEPFDRWTDMAKVLPELVRLEAYRTVYSLACKHVRDPRLRVVLTFQSLLVGGNPFATTSVYCLIAFLERRWGVHFPMGGTGRLVTGLVGLIEGQGGQVRCNAEVAQICVTGEGGERAASGVRLANGESLAADVVVSNCDSAWTYKHLLAPEHRHRWTDRRIERARYSMSLFVWYFGTDRRYEDVAHHTILLGPRYRELLGDIFDRKLLADDFSLYLHRPTATDPSLAPDGCDAFYVLSPVPHLDSGTDWERAAEPYRRLVEARLEEKLLPGLGKSIVTSRLLTPQDFQDRLSSFKGAAFGLEPVLTQSAWFRPHNRSEEVDRLYLVGAGTHPGAGLPGVLSSARILDKVVPHADALVRAEAAPERNCMIDDCTIAPADLAVCRRLLANGSRTFLAASWLLPRPVRDAACALYAFCRLADDAVDRSDDGAIDVAVDSLRTRLAAIYAGLPADHAADRALAVVVRGYGIARALPEALIEGFAWDAEGRPVETLDDLHAYAARVAGSVGAMMALLMGARAPAELARACDLGVAMQLSNIARDVGEDARMGRLYLPRAWMRDAGLDPDAWLREPAHSVALGSVVRRLLDEADRLYARVGTGIAQLPAACRPGINAARHLYAAIGHEVVRRDLDAVTRRAVVPARRKARLLVAAAMASLLPPAVEGRSVPPLPATLFLVDAAADRSMRPVARRSASRRWRVGARAVWTIELFERLERQDLEASVVRWSVSKPVGREALR